MRKWFIDNCKWIALGGWAIVAITIIVKIVLQGTKRSVYPLFVCGGAHWKEGLSVYTGECLNFQYWPGFAAFMSLFSWFPENIGIYLWSFLNISILIIGVLQFVKTYSFDSKKGYQWIVLLLAIPMSLDGLINQQSNPLLAGFVLLGVAFAGQSRWWMASLFLLLPGLTKIAPLCFCLLIVSVYPRQMWWRLVVVLPFLLLIPFALQNIDYVYSQYQQWFDVLKGESGERWAYRDAYVWYELLSMGRVSNHEKVMDMQWYRMVQVAAAGFAFCMTCLSVYVRKTNGACRGAIALCWGSWWLILFGPSTEVATCVMGTGAAAWCLLFAFEKHYMSLMLIAFVLLCIGSNGEIEYELGKTFGDWNKGILSLGAIFWGGWMVANILRCGQKKKGRSEDKVLLR